MRIWIGLILCVAALVAAEKPAAKKAQPARAKAAAVTLPAGAVEAEPGTWRYTDQQGRKWLYRKTPWGLVRFEERQDATTREPAAKSEPESTRAFDDGEYVRFERQGPFGVYRWRRSKTELNEAERRAWERAQASARGTETRN